MTRQARREADQAEYRASLERAEQALQEQGDQPEPTEREVQLVKEQAVRALAEGRTVFVTRTRSTTFQRLGENLIGDSEVARVIDAVESAGWRLDQMSHYPFVGLATVYEFGIYLFRPDR